MQSKYLQASCSSVQNVKSKKVAKKGRKNDLLGNHPNKKNHNH
jgi:hypothetical protein